MTLAQVLALIAVLGVGVVYGTDVFFAVVARTALGKASERAMAEVMGRLHEVADRRMPFFGAVGLLATLGAAVATRGGPAAVAAAAEVAHLALYQSVARPVNAALTLAAAHGEPAPDARALQARWDSVIGWRAALLTVAVAALLFALTGA
jgi:hypothetical protein